MKRHTRNHQSAGRRKGRSDASDGPLWIWGSHAVAAALANPDRTQIRLVATENAARRGGLKSAEILSAKEIDTLVPGGAVHQGIALRTDPLEPLSLDALIAAAPPRIAVLDQLADPRNMGAIYRSAAAFGIEALILQTRHSPPITGVVAKTAVGAVETVKEVRVVNIARTLETLADAGWLTLGLAGETDDTLEAVVTGESKLALVLGAEGAGLRHGVQKACQRLVRIPMAAGMESLNVSAAAAIAFYECSRGHISA